MNIVNRISAISNKASVLGPASDSTIKRLLPRISDERLVSAQGPKRVSPRIIYFVCRSILRTLWGKTSESC